MSPPLFFLSSDARVIDLIKKGDEEALVILYEANRRPITSFVVRNSGNPQDAEDMLQEALVVLWERVRAGKFEYTAQLGTFIFATVKNMWLRQLARLRREVPSELDPDTNPANGVSALEMMIEDEQASLVREALDKLGEPCRKLLLLFYWEELSMEQIAEQLGFANAETAKSKKYQCKKSLEKLLKEYREAL
ncbi:MAG: sigma-70 family RNA polymerase sigma factor [Ignavibacteria bacterium]|nr:sigma-70 family RNA polymerase sigma factor [Ignavibacteria bacterium]